MLTKGNLTCLLVLLAADPRHHILPIGGASILINYGFRDSTYDVDAVIGAASAMKDAINYVTDQLGLPNGWLNDDFQYTKYDRRNG